MNCWVAVLLILILNVEPARQDTIATPLSFKPCTLNPTVNPMPKSKKPQNAHRHSECSSGVGRVEGLGGWGGGGGGIAA